MTVISYRQALHDTLRTKLRRDENVFLSAHPEVSVSWDETRILRHRHVSVGIAVAIDDGLIVPVIRDAGRKTLTEIARESRDLITRARARKLTPDELSGGTFTVSNLGMYGIRQFTAVINRRRPPSSPSAKPSGSLSCTATRSPLPPP